MNNLLPNPLPSAPSPIPHSALPTPHLLASRSPRPHFSAELGLFLALPTAIRADLRLLLGERPGCGAFGQARHLIDHGASVQSAIASIRNEFSIPGSLKRLRARFDAYTKSADWVALVNLTKAGPGWQARDDGLPPEFVKFCAKRFSQFKRADGKRQAVFAIHSQWLTGRNSKGDREPIPGYGYKPADSIDAIPRGWTYGNILRQVKAANLFPAPVQAIAHQSTAAARAFIPRTRFDRNTMADGSPLRFLERVEFDDVKTDFLILDPDSGQVMDLWLLIARDLATAILLGFGMRPALTRPDGSQQHLRLRDMKQLSGYVLERYGLPPYTTTWKIEHGTATLSPGSRAQLDELFNGRVNLSFSGMIGGRSPEGFRERAIGNSAGKASLESHNRLMHTMAANLPGATGPIYTIRPSDLAARAADAAKTWNLTRFLPENLRGQVGYSLLTVNQAREHLRRIFDAQNNRTDHDLQGFDEVLEWWDGRAWQPSTTFPAASAPRIRKRKESPLERCARLVAPYRDDWLRVSPEVVTSFYAHLCRQVAVKLNGLIDFTIDGRQVEFAPPGRDGSPQPSALILPGTKLLAYSHPDDPAYLHLTDGAGRFYGTWLRRTAAQNPAQVAEAIRYSAAALKAARDMASDYAADSRAELAATAARNQQLLAQAAIESPSLPSLPSVKPSQRNFPTWRARVAAALGAVPASRTAHHEAQADAQALADALTEAPSSAPVPQNMNTNDHAQPIPPTNRPR